MKIRNSLRSLLDGKPPRLISGRFDGYRLEVEACAVDADLFAKAVRAARSIHCTSGGIRWAGRGGPAAAVTTILHGGHP